MEHFGPKSKDYSLWLSAIFVKNETKSLKVILYADHNGTIPSFITHSNAWIHVFLYVELEWSTDGGCMELGQMFELRNACLSHVCHMTVTWYHSPGASQADVPAVYAHIQVQPLPRRKGGTALLCRGRGSV